VVALVVSAAAVYASVAALVAQRTHEIGIRMALGASRTRITTLVMSRVASMMAIGTIVGIAAALGLWQTLVNQGFALGTPTVGAFVATTLTLWCAAGTAVLLPVGRATRVSPLVALRE
jgi:putative ABC transport system permease protein